MSVVTCLSFIAALAAPSGAYERPGRTIRVSVSSTGEQADVNAEPPKFIPNSKGYIDTSGRYVTFEAWAPNLVAEDREGILRPHIFRHDLVTRETVRVSVRYDGKKSDQGGRGAQQSADGRYVAFYSAASDMSETPDRARGTDVYVRDMQEGVTEKITVAPDGSDGSNGSTINLNSAYLNDISSDGRFVTFSSSMTNLTENVDTNGRITDTFLRDRQTDKTEIVSLSNSGEQGNDAVGSSSVTTDGTEVIFESWATNLVDQPIGPGGNIYVRDRAAGTTTLLEVAGEGVVPDGEVSLSGMSDDGRFVLFNSGATNLIPYDGNATWDTFIYDRETERVERVSVANDGSEGDAGSYGWEMSPDGRYITFESDASNMVVGDTNRRGDAFVRDRLLETTRRISLSSDGSEGNRESTYSSVSADGSIAAFDSASTNFVEGDTNQEKDIFVRFLGPELGLGELNVEVGGGSVTASGWAGFSGAVVANETDAAGDVADTSADLIGAVVINRPEDESVQLRWDVEELNPVGAPGVIYGASFTSSGTSWEIRGMPSVAGVPRFDLYECASTCVRVVELRGRYGREGSTVVATIPYGTGPFAPPAAFEDMTLYTALGEGLVGKISDLDVVPLGAVELGVPALSFGLAPRGSSDVSYGPKISPDAGAFSRTIDLGGADPSTLDLWARTCLGTTCTSTVRSLGDEQETPLVASVLALDLTKHRGDVRATFTLRSESGAPLEGRALSVFVNEREVASLTTDASGVAVLDLERRAVRPGDLIEGRFAGDSSFLPSAAARTVTVQDL